MRKSFFGMIIALFIGFFSAFCDLNVVFASELNEGVLYEVIDYNVLNNYSDTIEFTVDNNVIIYGSFDNLLLVSDVISQLDVDNLVLDYLIDDISVFSDDLLLVDSDVVVNGMDLVITIGDDKYVYKIVVVGDFNDDGIVNKDDVSVIVDTYKLSGLVSYLNDINGDDIFDNRDISEFIYAINSNSWNELSVVNEFSINDDEIYVNDEFEIVYTIKGIEKEFIDDIGGNLVYDNEAFEFVGYDIGTNNFIIDDLGKFSFSFDDLSQELILTFKFKAIKEGTFDISINDIVVFIDDVMVNMDKDFYVWNVVVNGYGIGGDVGDDYEELPDDNIPSVDNVPTIKEDVSSSYVNNMVYTPLVNSRVVEDSSDNVVATVISLSSDSKIKSLVIKGYEIDFNMETYNYDLDVSYEVDSLDLDVELSDNDASYEILGNKKFKVGNNVVSIVVTAVDGSESTYTINVLKKSNDEDVVEEEVSNSSRVVIIILIILVIIGLIYVIFKDDEEDEKN